MDAVLRIGAHICNQFWDERNEMEDVDIAVDDWSYNFSLSSSHLFPSPPLIIWLDLSFAA
jgi:hypothetical protein